MRSWGWVPHDRISGLLRRGRAPLLWERVKLAKCKTGRELSLGSELANTMILNFPASNCEKINFCCFIYPSVVFCYHSLSWSPCPASSIEHRSSIWSADFQAYHKQVLLFLKDLINLDVPDVSCSMWDLRTLLRHARSLLAACRVF